MGFSKKDEPDTFMDDIENITRLKVTVSSSKIDKPPLTVLVECESQLKGDDVFFKEKQ